MQAKLTFLVTRRTEYLAKGELCVVLQLVAEGILAWGQVVCVVGGGEVMAHGKVTISEHLIDIILPIIRLGK